MTRSKDYFENLDRVFNGDKALIHKACQSFLKHSPGYMQNLEEARKFRNGSEFKRVAHSFKASFNMFGDSEARNTADKLEKMGESDAWEGSKALLEKFCLQIMEARRISEHIISSDFAG